MKYLYFGIGCLVLSSSLQAMESPKNSLLSPSAEEVAQDSFKGTKTSPRRTSSLSRSCAALSSIKKSSSPSEQKDAEGNPSHLPYPLSCAALLRLTEPGTICHPLPKNALSTPNLLDEERGGGTRGVVIKGGYNVISIGESLEIFRENEQHPERYMLNGEIPLEYFIEEENQEHRAFSHTIVNRWTKGSLGFHAKHIVNEKVNKIVFIPYKKENKKGLLPSFFSKKSKSNP